VSDLFGRTASKSVNPDEAVAMGAAIQVLLLIAVCVVIVVFLLIELHLILIFPGVA